MSPRARAFALTFLLAWTYLVAGYLIDLGRMLAGH